MSDPFSHKEYGEYFETLTRQLGSEKAVPPVRSQPQRPLPVRRKRKRKTRIKPAAIFTFFVVIGVAAILVFLSAFGKFSAKTGSGKTAAVPETRVPAASETESVEQQVKEPIVFKETDKTVAAPSGNDAESLIMVKTETNEIVTARDPKRKLFPASTTKIMTLLVAVEKTENLEDTFEMTQAITDEMYVAEATVAGFSPGEQVEITDLLYGTILRSGGDAAMGLAEKLAGSQEKFVGWMNEKVKELGLKDTHFTNVTGLHDPNHYTTAYDLAVILKAALEVPLCKEVLSTYLHTTKATPQHPEGIKLSATLFDFMYGTEPETATILGGKTGFVNESGYCIATYGKNNTTGTEYIAVTMKNSARWPAVFGQIDLYKEFAK